MVKWGIIGLGKIAGKFAEGLKFVDNAVLYAVASSSHLRAEEFAKEFSVLNYSDSYEAMVKLPELDVVYIASNNNLHYEHVKLCLENNKHVLCEKPFTANYSQTKELFDLAQQKGLFLMEALWTRFLPSMSYLELLVMNNTFGAIKSIDVSFGFVANPDPQGRLLNKELGGGALLDIGIYPIFLCNFLLGTPDKINVQVETGETGVDIHSLIAYEYKNAKAQFTCSFKEKLNNEAVITFEKAVVKLHAMWHCPTKVEVITYNSEFIDLPWAGNGYNYEAQYVTDTIANKSYSKSLFNADNSLALIKQITMILEK
ncbi:MAG: Gfo/Idh/MocA family oxidoreductase [Bacteroidales bacterium]|nr:Gfo/Idh/MocA family oxidoreductase [Bacteroidales bacterium]